MVKRGHLLSSLTLLYSASQNKHCRLKIEQIQPLHEAVEKSDALIANRKISFLLNMQFCLKYFGDYIGEDVKK